MRYSILTDETAIRYVLAQAEIAEFLGGCQLECSEIGDGNLNQVFILKNKIDSSRSVILKQALPYLRCVGESYPLGRDRMKYEIRSLIEFSKLCCEHTPIIYHENEEMSLIVMQNLDSHVIMRKGIIDGVKYPLFAEHISDFLAKTLFFTSSLALSSAAKQTLKSRFLDNVELCRLTEDFVFTLPYMTHETNRHDKLIDDEVQTIRMDGEFKRATAKLKDKFMNCPQALLHGDLHTGSIMLNEKETFVIDSEFAFFGPIGFDVGAVFGNLLMGYAASMATKNDEYAKWLLDTAQEVLELFTKKFKQLWEKQENSALFSEPLYWEGLEKDKRLFQDEYIRGLLQDIAGFAGCKMMRRQMGIAHVLDIDSIEDENARALASKNVINIARQLTVNHEKLSGIEEIMAVVLRSTK